MSDLKQKIFTMVQNDLAEIETALTQNLNPYLDLVSQTAKHILFSGGKRLRPLLMVISAKICGYHEPAAKMFSIIFEYLHAATLLHDDLVDEATLRRGKPVAHSIWGNSTAVLVGDFLLARSLMIAAETENPTVIKIIAKITENMSQGEIHQLLNKGDLNLLESEYMEIIRRKTAVLIQGACRVGAIIAKADKKLELALSRYGFNLGMAFQMMDDLLDYTSNTSVLGKTIGADLREGKLTLPVIYSLKAADTKDRAQMEKIIKSKNFSVHGFEKLIGLLKKYNGIAYTRQLAEAHIRQAREAVSFFGPTKHRELLENIADYAITRKL